MTDVRSFEAICSALCFACTRTRSGASVNASLFRFENDFLVLEALITNAVVRWIYNQASYRFSPNRARDGS